MFWKFIFAKSADFHLPSWPIFICQVGLCVRFGLAQNTVHFSVNSAQ